MSKRIVLDAPPYPSRRSRLRRAVYRWVVVVLVALVAVCCIVAPPAIAAAIHFGV